MKLGSETYDVRLAESWIAALVDRDQTRVVAVDDVVHSDVDLPFRGTGRREVAIVSLAADVGLQIAGQDEVALALAGKGCECPGRDLG